MDAPRSPGMNVFHPASVNVVTSAMSADRDRDTSLRPDEKLTSEPAVESSQNEADCP